jgi:hypothetical protein
LVPSQINKLPAEMNHLQEEETPAIAFAAIPEDSSRDVEKGDRAGLVVARRRPAGQQVGCCNTK